MNRPRSQPIWLPTNDPETTNISPEDFNAMGAQAGSLGAKFNYNSSVFQRVRLDSGVNSANPSGVVSEGQLAFWKNKDEFLVTNDRRQCMATLGLEMVTSGAYRKYVAGFFRSALTAGHYVDILKKGVNVPCAESGNFTVGVGVVAGNNETASVVGVALGTAPAYQRLGVARGVDSGGFVNVDVDVDFDKP